MTDYYKEKRNLNKDIERVVTTMKGKTLTIASLELQVISKYGFGRIILMKMLQVYEAAGKLEIDGKNIKIK